MNVHNTHLATDARTHAALARLTHDRFTVAVHGDDEHGLYYVLTGAAADRPMLESRAADVGAHVFDLRLRGQALTAKLTL